MNPSTSWFSVSGILPWEISGSREERVGLEASRNVLPKRKENFFSFFFLASFSFLLFFLHSLSFMLLCRRLLLLFHLSTFSRLERTKVDRCISLLLSSHRRHKPRYEFLALTPKTRPPPSAANGHLLNGAANGHAGDGKMNLFHTLFSLNCKKYN